MIIGIINYGSGNIYAIANIYNKLGIKFQIITESKDLVLVDKLILPGVGAFDETMKLIKSCNMYDEINDLVVEKKIPILGVCVGMQVFANTSEEGTLNGFSWIPGKVSQIDHSDHPDLVLPHMGWNSLEIKSESKLMKNIDLETGFYFLHSYRFVCDEPQDILAEVLYGNNFTCAVNKDNVYGVQFHPEKSHENGITLFKNFAYL